MHARDLTLIPVRDTVGFWRKHGRDQIDVRTEDSEGRPVQVDNGRFDTSGSLTGLVPEIWIDETVYLPRSRRSGSRAVGQSGSRAVGQSGS